MTMCFPTILVGVDGREGGRDAIALARVLAGPESRMVLGHVWTYGTLGLEERTHESQELLERERAAAEVDASLEVTAHNSILHGLQELMERHHADLLVVGGSHRSAVGRLLLGDVGREVLHHATWPVALAPRGYAHDPSPLRTVGAAWNDTPDSWPALDVARRVAGDRGAGLRALSVVDVPSGVLMTPVTSGVVAGVQQQALDEARKRLDRLEGVDGQVVTGAPAAVLRDFSKSVDLLVLGSRGRGALKRLLLGSTGDLLIHHAECPLLVLPPGAQPAGARHASAGDRAPR